MDPTIIRPLVLVALLSGCTAGSPPRPSSQPAHRQVQTARAERSSRAAVTEVVGTVQASRRATIASLISGTVAEVRVGLGSSVRAGDVLVRLSAREVEARLEAMAGSVKRLADAQRVWVNYQDRAAGRKLGPSQTPS